MKRGDKVIDVAMGTGKNLPILRRNGWRDGLVIGVDVMLERLLKEYQNIVLIRANN